MSLIVLDDHLLPSLVQVPVQRWATVKRLHDLRPAEVIKDDRVPSLLRAVKRPTFVTIAAGFCNRSLRDPAYCILYFALRDDQQTQLPRLLRRLFRLPEFRTRAVRMGKVARISSNGIEYWQHGERERYRLAWRGS